MTDTGLEQTHRCARCNGTLLGRRHGCIAYGHEPGDAPPQWILDEIAKGRKAPREHQLPEYAIRKLEEAKR